MAAAIARRREKGKEKEHRDQISQALEMVMWIISVCRVIMEKFEHFHSFLWLRF